MKLGYTLFYSFLLVGLLLSVNSFGQFRNWDRFEIGGGFIVATGEFIGSSTVVDPVSGSWLADSSTRRSIMTKFGYGVTVGKCIPLKRLGHTSIWAFTIHLMANEFVWGDVNEVYNTSSYKVNTTPGTISVITQQLALPFGIDYKVGTDAIKSQRLRTGASFGIGLMPSYNGSNIESLNSKYDHTDGYSFGISPYVKAEVALFSHYCWKLRIQTSFGNVFYVTETDNIVNGRSANLTDAPFRIRGLTNTSISLIIMPFSKHWSEYAWWNTYDTYRRFDKMH